MGINSTTLAANVSAWGKETQTLFSQARVAICGQNELSDYLTILLVGLGVDSIQIQGERTQNGLNSATSCIDVNPQTNIERYNMRYTFGRIRRFNPTHIFNLEEDTQYANNISNATNQPALLQLYTHHLRTHPQILASLVAENFRRTLIHYTHNEYTPNIHQIQKCIPFQPNTLSHQKPKNDSASNTHSVIVGAGGIGTYVALALASDSNQQITLIDDDIVQAHNLNRQLLYINAIGEKKVDALAKALTQINTLNTYSPLCTRVLNSDDFRKYLTTNKVTQVFCATDNFESRLVISKACALAQIPLIEGGCNTRSAVVTKYEPGFSQPTHITRQYERFIKPAQKIVEQNNCSKQANPSIIIPNMMAGGMMNALRTSSNILRNNQSIVNAMLYYNPILETQFEVLRYERTL